MKKSIFFLFFILIQFGTQAQQPPVYNLYFLDPHLINPAAAGFRGFGVMNLNHRQQWRGIEGAPVTSTLSLHFPVGNNLALGGMAVNDVRGPFSTNTAQFSVGYRVPIQQDDHNLRFGLGGGAGWNRLDFEKLGTTSDPVLATALGSYTFWTGRFGALYNYRSMFIGFVFPTLFRPPLISDQNPAETVFEPLQNYLVTASYRFGLGEHIALEPMAVYRAYNRSPAQWECTALLHIKNLIWMGATWRQDYGWAGLAGFHIGDLMTLGYSYEPAVKMVSGFADATHELQFNLRIGKKKKAPVVSKTVTPEPKAGPEQPVYETPPVAETSTPEPSGTNQERAQSGGTDDSEWLDIEQAGLGRMIERDYGDAPVLVKRGQSPMELPVGHYVITGVFSQYENAERYSDWMSKKGYNASFGFLTAKGLFYVWQYKGNAPDDTRRRRDELRKTPQFRDAWYLQVQN